MSNLNNTINDKIIRTCNYVTSLSKHVKINEENLKKFVKEKLSLFEATPSWTSCHFNPNEYSQELLVSFVCVLDSLNFCFWPMENFEYNNLVDSIIDVLKNDVSFFKAENLMQLSLEEFKQKVFKGIDFPLIEERLRSLNEMGQYVFSVYGSFEEFLKKNNYDCLNIATSIIQGVSTFRDESIFMGKQIFFYKRAQILAADLYYALRELNDPIILERADKLTMFADYRVPQILRELEILTYDETLSNNIDSFIQISPNSHEETEIRALTIICVEKIKEEIKLQHKTSLLSLEVDYVLWTEGENLRKIIKPHHRTLTIFY